MLRHALEMPARFEMQHHAMLFTASREPENDNPHLSKSIVHILARDRVKFRLAWSSEVW